MTTAEHLFKEMTGYFAYKFSGGYGSEPTKAWIAVLEGMSLERVQYGIDRTFRENKKNGFPPTPLDFRLLCIPASEDLGLLSESEAFHQALRSSSDKRPRSPEVIKAREFIGDLPAFRLAKTETAEKIFSKAWVLTVEYVMAGGKLPEAELVIEKTVQKAPPEVMKKGINDLMNMFSDC